MLFPRRGSYDELFRLVFFFCSWSIFRTKSSQMGWPYQMGVPTPATAPLTKLPGKGHSTRQVGFLLLMKWSDFVETVVRLYNEALYPLDDNRRHYFLSVSGMIYRVFI